MCVISVRMSVLRIPVTTRLYKGDCAITEYTLEDFPVFKDFEPGLIELLRKQGKVSTLVKEAVVHTQMEKCSSVGFILKGTLRMTKVFSSGKEFVIRNLSSGEMFGELVCFAGNNYPCWIVATEDSTIFEIPRESMLTLLQDKDFLRAFMKSISKKSLHLNNTIELLSLKKVNQKIAYNLLSRSEEKGSRVFELDVTITGLAVQVGSTREAVSRSFSELESLGCIKRDGTNIEIVNHEDLENIITG